MKKMFLVFIMCTLFAMVQGDQPITRAQRETATTIVTTPITTTVVLDKKTADEFYRALLTNLSNFLTSHNSACTVNMITALAIAHSVTLYRQILIPTSKFVTVVDYSYANMPIDLLIPHPTFRVNGRYLLRYQPLASEDGLYLCGATGMLTRDTATENDFRTNGLGYGLVFSTGNPQSICFYFPDAAAAFKFIDMGIVGSGLGECVTWPIC